MKIVDKLFDGKSHRILFIQTVNTMRFFTAKKKRKEKKMNAEARGTAE